MPARAHTVIKAEGGHTIIIADKFICNEKFHMNVKKEVKQKHFH